ncbi:MULTISPECIES: maleylpyruvate isomerase family mycothiol-dependent enzyme [unclassified Streptomyces]|uniref:maleylpyruvate isomerase family mycothiol-dependent enzyme n=1 Tax=unclassified Streptomyces TaxID=2593676 RepID=UPI00382E58F3
METAEFIETLRRNGTLLADAAERAGLDAAVPPCPDWRVRDLVRHQGTVHRWATRFVAEGRMRPEPITAETPADDRELLGWFRDGHERLVTALETAPQDLECWYFLRADSPLGFWARRQAHETAVHRVDAEIAAGRAPSPVDPAFAADGIDELLTGFHTRPKSRVRTEAPGTLRVRAVDLPEGRADWLARLSAEPLVVEQAGEGAADCTVSGTAADLYLALWNRAPYEKLQVSGDISLVALWRRTGAVT